MRIAVIGIGNLLAADDGVGIEAVRRLSPLIADERVRFSECERGGLDLLEPLEGCDHAIIIDAALTGLHGPGTIVSFTLQAEAHPVTFSSLHTIDTGTILALGSATGLALPHTVTVVCMEAADTLSFGAPLTSSVAGALPHLIAVVRSLIEEHLQPDHTQGLSWQQQHILLSPES